MKNYTHKPKKTKRAKIILFNILNKQCKINTIAAIMANLSDIDLEYPEFINPAGDCPKAIIESLPKLCEPEHKDSVEKWKIQLRALLVAAPGLFPPHMLSLAEESFHQIIEGLPPIEWSKEDPAVQISRIYNFIK
jgi:hypothetical protein